MKVAFNLLIFLLIIFFVMENAVASSCVCWPHPYTKKYPSDGYNRSKNKLSIKWSCDYTCSVKNEQSMIQKTVVTARYAKTYRLPENGLEGICEGMIYESEFNPNAPGFSLYTYNGRNEYFNPHTSKSEDLKSFARSQNCEKPGILEQFGF